MSQREPSISVTGDEQAAAAVRQASIPFVLMAAILSAAVVWGATKMRIDQTAEDVANLKAERLPTAIEAQKLKAAIEMQKLEAAIETQKIKDDLAALQAGVDRIERRLGTK